MIMGLQRPAPALRLEPKSGAWIAGGVLVAGVVGLAALGEYAAALVMLFLGGGSLVAILRAGRGR